MVRFAPQPEEPTSAIARPKALPVFGLILVACVSTSLVAPLEARVVRVEILERTAFAEGRSFGTVGPYERIRGRLHYAVDPRHPRNAAVVDLKLALEGRLRSDISEIAGGRIRERLGGDPRNASGEVEFAGDFLLLKPVDLSRGNHRLLYGVTNRGTPLMLAFLNSGQPAADPSSSEHAGNGWLMREGYSLLWTAWNWDVEKVEERPLRINLPVIVDESGSPLTGKVNAELEVVSQDGIRFLRLAWGGSRCYPAAAGHERDAVLTVRDAPDAEPAVIERSRWEFARVDPGGEIVPDPYHVYLPAGFEKGRLYEVVYTAAGPRVVGLGLAAVRDAISFFRFESRDAAGREQPLVLNGRPDPRYAYIFGLSQSGRFITHMIHQGFHIDEQDRLVFEGALPLVGGGGKGGFNFRWAQTTHHPKHLEGNGFPADFFPFNYTENGVEQFDPLAPAGRRHGDILAAAKREGKIPKILICNHELEYWTRSASLVHTDVEGSGDVTPHPNVRVYMINGARHGTPGGSRFSPEAEHAIGQIDQRPVGRALVRALDRWVSQGVLPPPSRVPRMAAGELLTAQEHARRFPAIPAIEVGSLTFPAVRHPGRNLQPARLDYGPRFWTEGIQDIVPPAAFGPRYRTLVPAFDADGNGLGGIRLPDLEVPLGTYQGFNPRRTGTGAEDYLTPFLSSFWPFALTRQERVALGDGRLSIEERYPSQAAYVERVRAAAWGLEAEGFLLEEDVLRIVGLAESLQWPPVPTDAPPYWRTRE
ncbi:MAG: alpha/beta hydrolase domain-containing protein [Acidobacteriota bacterium]